MNRTKTLLRIALLATLLPMSLTAQEAKPPSRAFRVTYTLIVTDAGKRVGVQHFSLTVSGPSNRGNFKLGEKIPVATGSYNADGKSGVQTQFTYLDVGLNIDATVTEDAHNIQLMSKVEQSSVAPVPAVIGGVSEPIIRQTVLANSSFVSLNKSVTLGSLDIPDTTRHVDIEAVVEPIT